MLDSLLQEATPTPSHALAAMGAVVLGGAQLASAKGTGRHRALGWAWRPDDLCGHLIIFYH